MCGIAGIFDTRESAPVNSQVLRDMTGSLAHRGPDADGFFVEDGVGLGHRRLSIIDLEGGVQPFLNDAGTVAMTYNGEVYNFAEMRDELRAVGHEFHTHSDTEVLVHAWEEWGEACVERFNGMFALGIYDRRRRCLFLARDRLGIKPLYYGTLPNGLLVFGSELKALLQAPWLERHIDPLAVEDYFAYGYVPEPRTILSGVHKLPPGHTLTVTRGKPVPEPVQYWDVAFQPGEARSEADIEAEIRHRVTESVKLRMIADVPLGAFLSGGVDSSAVVAAMADLKDSPVKTCSISFGDPKFNESAFAQVVADRFATDHDVRQVDPADFDLIDRLVEFYDEPYADSSAMPTYRVCGLARNKVTVALSGDGGDENFAGYRRYRWHAYEERVRRLLPPGLRGPVFGLAGRLYPKMDWAPKVLRAKSTLQALARDSLEGYFHSVSILTPDERAQLFSPAFRRSLQGYQAVEVLAGHARRSPTDDPLSLVQYLDFKTYLPGDILTKVDRASMAHSLEVRVPLLDHTFVDWVSGLGPAVKLRGREGKYIFKKALEPVLPHDILYRPKMGFAVPIGQWFKGPLADRVRSAVLGLALERTGIFDTAFLERMLREHQSGQRDHSSALWALLMFDGFQRRVMS